MQTKTLEQLNIHHKADAACKILARYQQNHDKLLDRLWNAPTEEADILIEREHLSSALVQYQYLSLSRMYLTASPDEAELIFLTCEAHEIDLFEATGEEEQRATLNAISRIMRELSVKMKEHATKLHRTQ